MAFLILALAVVVGILVSAVRYGAPPMPSCAAVETRVARLAAMAGPAPVVVDAGAGWGRLAATVADRVPRATVVAVEAAPLPWLICRLRALGRPNLVVQRQDFRIIDWGRAWGGADLVVAYLTPAARRRFVCRWRATACPGTWLACPAHDTVVEADAWLPVGGLVPVRGVAVMYPSSR